MKTFQAHIQIIGANPFVFVPVGILKFIFKQWGREIGPIPVTGKVNNKHYKQTLLRYAGEWRLYVNTNMLKNSPKRVGEKITISIDVDREERTILMPDKLRTALEKNFQAKVTFESLPPSRQKEIVRYIANLKTDDSIQANIHKAIGFLTGKNRFVGRDKP